MPYGFSCDEVGEFLGVSRSKSTQAFNDAVDKVAKAHIYDRNRAERMMLDRIEWWIKYYETPDLPARPPQEPVRANGRGR